MCAVRGWQRIYWLGDITATLLYINYSQLVTVIGFEWRDWGTLGFYFSCPPPRLAGHQQCWSADCKPSWLFAPTAIKRICGQVKVKSQPGWRVCCISVGGGRAVTRSRCAVLNQQLIITGHYADKLAVNVTSDQAVQWRSIYSTSSV